MVGAGSATIKLNDSRTHNDKSLWNSTVFGIVFLNVAIIEMQKQMNQTAVLQMMYFIKRDNYNMMEAQMLNIFVVIAH